MTWTLCLYRTDDDCAHPVLVGEVARTRLPIIMLEAGRGVVLRHVPVEEQRYMTPIVERTKRDPLRRFRGLLNRQGGNAAAKAALEATKEVDAAVSI